MDALEVVVRLLPAFLAVVREVVAAGAAPARVAQAEVELRSLADRYRVVREDVDAESRGESRR